MATFRPIARPQRNLLQRINDRNPYLRENAAVPGARMFSTTADLFNSMSFVNDQLDLERFAAEDRIRKTNRDPQVVLRKKLILTQAGYTPEEADQLANDPSFWRPEFEQFGLERPYLINPVFGGTVPKRDRIFRKAKEKIEDEVALEDYAQDLQLENSIEQEQRIREAFPEDYFEDVAPRSRRGSRSSGSRSARQSDSEAIIAATNREAILSKGKPVFSAPRTPADAPMAYVGQNLSRSIQDATTRRMAAESYFTTASTELREADSARRSASAALRTAQRSNDPGAIAAASRIFRDAEASYFTADARVAEAEQRLAEAEDVITGSRNRAEDAGLEVNNDTVFDAARGRVYNFTPIPQGPPAPVSASQIAARNRSLRERRLGPGQRASLESGLLNMDQAGVIDLEEDYFNPKGMRNALTEVLLSGNRFTVTPGGGINVQRPGADVTDRSARLSSAASRQARAFDEETEVMYLMQELMDADPNLDENTAMYLAVDAYRRGRKPAADYFAR